MNNQIIEDYCSFEVSKLLKEKGFTWNDFKPFQGIIVHGVPISNDNKFPCYEENGLEIRPNKYSEINKHYPRPTHALAIKWIRENFGLYISLILIHSERISWDYYIEKIEVSEQYLTIGPTELMHHNSPEEATEAALKYCLEKLKP